MEWLVATLVVLVVGGVVVLLFRQVSRRLPSAPSMASRIDEQGYGEARYERELSLWRGILKRLKVQAEQEESPPEPLRRQIAQAEARIAEAERRLGHGQ